LNKFISSSFNCVSVAFKYDIHAKEVKLKVKWVKIRLTLTFTSKSFDFKFDLDLSQITLYSRSTTRRTKDIIRRHYRSMHKPHAWDDWDGKISKKK